MFDFLNSCWTHLIIAINHRASFSNKIRLKESILARHYASEHISISNYYALQINKEFSNTYDINKVKKLLKKSEYL